MNKVTKLRFIKCYWRGVKTVIKHLHSGRKHLVLSQFNTKQSAMARPNGTKHHCFVTRTPWCLTSTETRLCSSPAFVTIPWWRHQMETFSALLAICAGIHRSPVNSPHKGQWRVALMFSLICVWINGWVNNREAGDLTHYRAYYDVTVMYVGATGGLVPLPRFSSLPPHIFSSLPPTPFFHYFFFSGTLTPN